MSWAYELRGAENRLIETHSGYRDEKAARLAGRFAECIFNCVCSSYSGKLFVVTREAAGFSEASEFPAPQLANVEIRATLNYPWQQHALDAFLEKDPKEQLRKIAIAERAISDRLLDPAPFEKAEKTELNRLLPVLRVILQEMARL